MVLTYFCLKYFTKEYLAQLCFFSCNKTLPNFALLDYLLYVKNSPIFSRVFWGHSLTHRAEDVLRTSKIQNVLATLSNGCSGFQKFHFWNFSRKNLPFLNILVISTVDRVPNMPTFRPPPPVLPSFSYSPTASLFFPQKTPIFVAAVANFY